MSKTDRRARATERTRRDILEAAARAFVRYGGERVTMQQIADEAGYAPAALYGYFAGKREILVGLVELIADELMSAFDVEDAPGLSLAQQLELLLRRVFTGAERRTEVFAFLPALDRDPDSLLDGTRHAGSGGPLELFSRGMTRWLGERAADDEFAPFDLQDAAYFLAGIVHAEMRRHLARGGGERLVDRARHCLALFFHGIRGAGDRTEV